MINLDGIYGQYQVSLMKSLVLRLIWEKRIVTEEGGRALLKELSEIK